MSLARYATRRDANEPDIIAALRKIGAEVEQFDEPVDLCVGWAQRWIWLDREQFRPSPNREVRHCCAAPRPAVPDRP